MNAQANAMPAGVHIHTNNSGHWLENHELWVGEGPVDSYNGYPQGKWRKIASFIKPGEFRRTGRIISHFKGNSRDDGTYLHVERNITGEEIRRWYG